MTKYCVYYIVRTHNTEECRARKNQIKESKRKENQQINIVRERKVQDKILSIRGSIDSADLNVLIDIGTSLNLKSSDVENEKIVRTELTDPLRVILLNGQEIVIE